MVLSLPWNCSHTRLSNEYWSSAAPGLIRGLMSKVSELLDVLTGRFALQQQLHLTSAETTESSKRSKQPSVNLHAALSLQPQRQTCLSARLRICYRKSSGGTRRRSHLKSHAVYECFLRPPPRAAGHGLHGQHLSRLLHHTNSDGKCHHWKLQQIFTCVLLTPNRCCILL